MLARKATNINGQELPQEWIEQVLGVLHEVYGDFCQQENRHVRVYGHRYEDEILLIICFRKGRDFEGLPLSFFISVDYQRSQRDEKLLKGLLDFSGRLIEDIFQKLKLAEEVYSTHWEENEYNNQKYYFKVSRENIELTLEAERILQKG